MLDRLSTITGNQAQPPRPHGLAVVAFVVFLAPAGAERLRAEDSKIDFGREILPILSESCFQCHGPDKKVRKAGLRLDERQGATAKLRSGGFAVVPGDSSRSEVYRRITSTDPDERMPPADSGKKLDDDEVARIRRWIDGGAEWAAHWAFQPPKRPEPPAPVEGRHTTNPVDAFIHAKLRSARIAPEPSADKVTLIRRVTLDLTGLPPTLREIDDFLADDSNDAYARVVDRLLRSESYAEHMARNWLDAARYADTHGLHLDNERSIWPYRDWVIDSFHRNQPFDEFTIEQLAGDLLPGPTLKQRVATGFNRCNVTTSEGGSIDAEYYVRYAVDRVETTSTVWLGLTAGCAVCHEHKFDPLTQKEFYQLFSYFYSLTEKAMDGNALLPPPSVKVPSRRQETELASARAGLTEVREEIEKKLGALEYEDPFPTETLGELEAGDAVWFDDELPQGAKPQGNEGAGSWKFVTASDKDPVLSGKTSSVRTATGLSQHFFTDAKNKLIVGEQDRLFAYVYLDTKNPPQTVQLQFNDGSWEHRAFWGADKGHGAGRNNASNLRIGDLPKPGEWARIEVAASAVGLAPGAAINGWAFTQFGGTVHWDKAGVRSIALLPPEKLESISLWEQYRAKTKHPPIPGEIQKILDVAREKRSAAQTTKLTRYFLEHVRPSTGELLAEPVKRRTDLEKKLRDIEGAFASTLVMEDRKTPRQAYILERGLYTEQREKVSSRVPQWIAPASADEPPNRLGLARWLVKPGHPLTARVTVNRFWQQLFGTGIVRTSEDFGTQGEQPSHPRLLDWLAVDFVESGWDVQRLIKMLVLSSTYRQSSRVSPEKLEADPDNRLLARGPRFRLDAEIVRDQALAISGLLVEEVGGKSVRPYQPAGLWKPVGFGGSNTSVFKQDSGSKLYRRSMYTFWKRTSPPPSMSMFDAPDRETCQVRRARTNTPLQALVLMNDVQFVEAARKLAERVLREGGADTRQRITFAFRSVVSRQPRESELETLGGFLESALAEYEKSPEAAGKLLSAGESKRDESLDVNELGAWTMVTHLLLNLSETITRG